MSSSTKLADDSYLTTCSDVVMITPAGPWAECKKIGGNRYYHDDQLITREEAESLWSQGTGS